MEDAKGMAVVRLRKRLQAAQGFTLAELLVAVAIVAVLSTMGITTAFSASRNMLLVELDSAATELAQVAQAQMTSLKVSGLWPETIARTGENPNQAQGLPPDADKDDIFYLSAIQAKHLGIIPSLSIDSSVYEGDFIIEYSRSTATVYSVFFADGRASAFSSAPAATNAATTYYQALTSAAGREEEARKDASPQIGYFQGTPSGAIKTVALKKPAIFIERGTGLLCVQNPNLTNSEEAPWAIDSLLRVTVTKEGVSEELSFSMSELIRTLGAFNIEAADLPAFSQASEGGELSIYSRDGLSRDDTYLIDLHRVLYDMSIYSDEYEGIASQFQSGDRVRVDVEVTSPITTLAAQPVRATAFLRLPGELAKLTVMVTNPDYREEGRARPAHINQNPGAYIDPKVMITSQGGGISTKAIKDVAPEQFALAGTSTALAADNPQAAYQAYTGGYVASTEMDSTMLIQASFGEYTPTGNTGHSSYGIAEIWIAGESFTRIGYLRSNTENDSSATVWQWEYAGFDEKILGQNLSLGQEVSLTEATALHLVPTGFVELCASLGMNPDSEGGYTVYVRTAPRTQAVEAFYQGLTNANLRAPAAGQTASVRETSTNATTMRRQIEAQFGAASSIALLTISRQAGGSDGIGSGISGFPTATSDYRIYYSYTPALGFAGTINQDTLKSAAYRPQNTVLWFKTGGTRFEQAAMVHPHRAGEWPEDIYLTLNGEGVFALPHQQDPLFYRALFYYNDDRTTLISLTGRANPQYVPYTQQGNSANPSNPVIQLFGQRALWYTNNVYNIPSGALTTSLNAGNTMGTYTSTVSAGRVNLYCASAGMMYVEFNDTEPTAWYGYVDGYDSGAKVSYLPSDNVKTNWGYYAILPYDTPAPTGNWAQFANQNNDYQLWVPQDPSPRVLTVDGVTYHAYRLNSNYSPSDSVLTTGAPSGTVRHTRLTIDQRMNLTFNGVTEIYYCNILFAATLDRTAAVRNTWGTATAPYQVRHADQLWGYLPRVYYGSIDSLEEYYDDLKYLQTHSFDMRGYQNVGNPQFYPLTEDWPRGGFVYDGGNFEITGYTLTETITNPSSTGVVGLYAGLFPRIGDGGVLRNVHMRDGVAASITTGAGGSYGRTWVGLLAGHVEGASCSITNCSVEGFDVDITLGGNLGYATHIGGMIGYMDLSNDLIDCSVSDVSITLDTGTQTPNRPEIDVGGLIGRAYGSVNVHGCNVNNADIKVIVSQKTTQVCTYLQVGGLIGWSYEYNTVDDCSARNIDIDIEGASWTNVAGAGNDVRSLRVGGLIGRNHYSHLRNSTADTIAIRVTAPLNRTTNNAYAGFGGFVGYSECPNNTYPYINVKAKDVTIDLDWTGSATSTVTGAAGMLGWVYSDDFTGRIDSTSSFSSVILTAREADDSITSEALTNNVGMRQVP